MNMDINLLGLVTAFSAFTGIWLGHVGVRAIERRVSRLWLPILGALGLGLGLEMLSLGSANRHLAAAAGVLGVTFLWDGLEFIRQEKRVQKGHAPANPQNPRHARILQAYPQATTQDSLAREPRGSSVSILGEVEA